MDDGISGSVRAQWTDTFYKVADNSRKLFRWFRDAGMLSDGSKGRVTCEDDGYNIVIVNKDTREPLFAIEVWRAYDMIYLATSKPSKSGVILSWAPRTQSVWPTGQPASMPTMKHGPALLCWKRCGAILATNC